MLRRRDDQAVSRIPVLPGKINRSQGKCGADRNLVHADATEIRKKGCAIAELQEAAALFPGDLAPGDC